MLSQRDVRICKARTFWFLMGYFLWCVNRFLLFFLCILWKYFHNKRIILLIILLKKKKLLLVVQCGRHYNNKKQVRNRLATWNSHVTDQISTRNSPFERGGGNTEYVGPHEIYLFLYSPLIVDANWLIYSTPIKEDYTYICMVYVSKS